MSFKLRPCQVQKEEFCETVCETFSDGKRYILRRNSARAKEMEQTRQGKQNRLHTLVDKVYEYLKKSSESKGGNRRKAYSNVGPQTYDRSLDPG